MSAFNRPGQSREKGQTETKRDPVFVFGPELRLTSFRVRFPRTPKDSLKRGASVNILNLHLINKDLQKLFVNHKVQSAKNATKSPNHSMLLKIYNPHS
jgi:hypothetical protein